MGVAQDLDEAADGSLAVELDALRAVLRRVGKGQSFGIADLAGDQRMEHDLDLARPAGRQRRAGAFVALDREGLGGDDTGKGDRIRPRFIGDSYRERRAVFGGDNLAEVVGLRFEFQRRARVRGNDGVTGGERNRQRADQKRSGSAGRADLTWNMAFPPLG